MFFFFIGGIQPKIHAVLRQARPCPVCGQPKVYLKRVDHYLSLFFIPLFPVKKGTPFLICENCHSLFDDRGRKVDVEAKELERRCPRCGRPVATDFSFCPYCGKAV